MTTFWWLMISLFCLWFGGCLGLMAIVLVQACRDGKDGGDS